MPVYNVEEYIGESIKSICAQTLQNFEVILVDDGSSDNSINVALEVLQRYSVIYQIIHQKNSGVSVARNVGIKKATGEWIICIDPDDCIHKQTFEILSTYIAENINVIAFNFENLSCMNNINNDISVEKIKIQYLPQKEIAWQFLLRQIKLIIPAVLIRKKQIIEKSLFYDEDVSFSEDQIYIWKLILNTQDICFIDYKLYYYKRRLNSTMTSSSIDKVMTGYHGMKRLTSSLISKNLIFKTVDSAPQLMLSRWILGVLHATSKYMNFQDFCKLTSMLDYIHNLKALTAFPDIRVALLAYVLCFNRRLFWIISKFI